MHESVGTNAKCRDVRYTRLHRTKRADGEAGHARCRAYRAPPAGSGTVGGGSRLLLDRRQERSDRRREHIAELNKRAAEADLRLKRLYDTIETGVADLGDPA
jgi:hypothetical protein